MRQLITSAIISLFLGCSFAAIVAVVFDIEITGGVE